jgi:hypothetical protein
MTFLVVALVLTIPALAQESASYNLGEHVLNAGGHPANGAFLSSASYRIRLDALGDAVAGTALSGASFHADAGFVSAYPPPGLVDDVRFIDHDTMVWHPEKSVGVYNLYRDLLSALHSLGYGSCEQHSLEEATATDAASPPASDGYFYLVTAENRLNEVGSKGSDSDGAPRANAAPCP